MTKHDRIIADLMTALDIILRETKRADGSLAYVRGAAQQAMTSCDAQRVRNEDGYLVVKA